MEIKLNIEGMMCPHCEARVKKALEALPQVKEANVSHKTGTAIVQAEDNTESSTLKKAVEDAGYKAV